MLNNFSVNEARAKAGQFPAATAACRLPFAILRLPFCCLQHSRGYSSAKVLWGSHPSLGLGLCETETDCGALKCRHLVRARRSNFMLRQRPKRRLLLLPASVAAAASASASAAT